jgi:hypothetical protein
MSAAITKVKMEALSVADSKRLVELERKIEQGFATFIIAPSFTYTGPPSAKKTPRPRRNSSEAKLSDRTADKPSLRPVSPKRKRVCPPFRDRFVSSLTVELESLLRSILAGQSQLSQSATLGGALHAMQLVRRSQFRRRRSKPKRTQAWPAIRSLPVRRP